MCACQRSIKCCILTRFSLCLSFLPMIGQLHSEPHWTVCKAGTSYPIIHGVIAIWLTVHVVVLPFFLWHFSLFLIFISLFSIPLTSLSAAVPIPPPTQQLCGGGWGVSQPAAVSAQAVHSCLCTTEQPKSVCLPLELLFTACAEYMELVTAALTATDVGIFTGTFQVRKSAALLKRFLLLSEVCQPEWNPVSSYRVNRRCHPLWAPEKILLLALTCQLCFWWSCRDSDAPQCSCCWDRVIQGCWAEKGESCSSASCLSCIDFYNELQESSC